MNAPQQIVITGISSELGRIIANEFAKDVDVKIIGTMRRKRSSEDDFPKNILILDNCDLTNPECCAQVANAAIELFNSPFGFIHSVGEFWDHVPFLEFSPEMACKMFESHVATLYNILQALVPVMQAKGGGSSIAFSCNSVRYNYPWMAAFTASKTAVDSLVRSMAHEFSGDGLRFNSLALASVKTEKVRQSKPHGDFDHFLPPENIVPIVRFLLSLEAHLVNGNSINLFQHSDQFYHAGYFDRIAK